MNPSIHPPAILFGQSPPWERFVFCSAGLTRSGSVCEEAPALSRSSTVVGGREVGCGKSPGGRLVISLLGAGGGAVLAGTQVDTTMHDGHILSGISAAIQVGGKVLMGGPDHPGVLMCDSASVERRGAAAGAGRAAGE